jgi:hypothetical protein
VTRALPPLPEVPGATYTRVSPPYGPTCQTEEEPVTAPQPDTRTPAGQVAYDAMKASILHGREYAEEVAAAVLAHDAAQRAARGEVVVGRDDLDVANRLLDLAGHGGLPAVDRLAALAATEGEK